jgi:hypothetical protein
VLNPGQIIYKLRNLSMANTLAGGIGGSDDWSRVVARILGWARSGAIDFLQIFMNSKPTSETRAGYDAGAGFGKTGAMMVKRLSGVWSASKRV